MKLSKLIGAIQRILANSPTILFLILKLRNQCNVIIGYSLVKGHYPEENGELLILEKFSAKFKNVLDVGANKGDWANIILRINSGILENLLVVEPGKSAFAVLEKRLKDEKKVILLNKGVSEETGELLFYEEYAAGERSSFLSIKEVNVTSSYSVPVTTIDEIVQEHGFETVDYLKVDCEGYDLKVMYGAKETLRRKKIELLQFEYNKDWVLAGATLKAAINFLNRFDYSVYLINHKGLHSFDVDKYGEYFSYSNFLAVAPAYQQEIEVLIKH